MKRLAFVAILITLIAVLGVPMAKADVVVKPCWAVEQVDGHAYSYYFWHGQKYHVDPLGQHWAVLDTACVQVDNSFVPRMGGPVRQAAASLHGRLSNLAERHASR